MVVIWLGVASAARPRRLVTLIKELAAPDFALESCRESAKLPIEGSYNAHWCCEFRRQSHDEFATIRLLKRLRGAGFTILRFDDPLGD